MKKILALIFAILMVFSVAACSKKDKVDSSTKTTTDIPVSDTDSVTEDPLDPKLPKKDYDGTDFIILCRDMTESLYNEFGVFEGSVNRVDDAVYKRNLYLNEKYNIKLGVLYKDFDKISSYVSDTLADLNYDLVNCGFMYQHVLAMNGNILNVNDIPTVDTSKEYWNQSILSDTSIAGQNYFLVSDANIWTLNAASVVFFNADLLHDLQMDDDNPYKLVKNNEWTFDKMNTMSKSVYKDLNGNNEVDLADRFGSVSTYAACETMFVGMGGTSVEKDGDDMPYVSVTKEKNIDIVGKIVDFWADQSALLINRHGNYVSERAGGNLLCDTLIDGRALFSQEQLYQLSTFSDSQYVIGMVPAPKYDDTQENYLTFVHMAHGSSSSVPRTITEDRLELAGAVLEDMAWYSNRNIRPEYYDVNLKARRCQDEESMEMLDVIFAHIKIDIGTLMQTSGFTATSIIRTLTESSNNSAAKYFDASLNTYNVLIDRLITAFTEGSQE